MIKLLIRATLFGLVLAQSVPLMAQVPNAPFALIGVIEDLELCRAGEACDRSDANALARMRVNGVWATLPRYLKIVMPGTYMTAQELFANKPGAGGGTPPASSGLAINDPDPPRRGVHADLAGNIVNGEYVVGLASIAPAGPLQTANGFVRAIDTATGTLSIAATPGGTEMLRVRLNDPDGRFGIAQSPDIRFQIDKDNPTVRAMTGYPICVPRPITGGDPRCPVRNRPAGQTRFTVGPVAATTGAPACAQCNPREMAPIVVGDHLTFAGLWVGDTQSGFLSASFVEAELGIFTSPGQNPAYVAIEESIWGTGGTPFPGLDQETGPGKVVPGQDVVTRFRIVGFTTDPSRNVEVQSVRIDPASGNERPVGPGSAGGSLRLASVQPEPNAPIGRFRVTVDRSVFLPATREIRVHIAGMPETNLPNGLQAGIYTAPVGEFIFPEGRLFGKPAVPMNFEDLCFLSQGEGPDTQRLAPFPESTASRSQPGMFCANAP